RSRPAPGTWTSFSCRVAAAISRVNARVTSTSTPGSRETISTSSATTMSLGIAMRARTRCSRRAAKVPAKATRIMAGPFVISSSRAESERAERVAALEIAPDRQERSGPPPARILCAARRKINYLEGNRRLAASLDVELACDRVAAIRRAPQDEELAHPDAEAGQIGDHAAVGD